MYHHSLGSKAATGLIVGLGARGYTAMLTYVDTGDGFSR